MRELLELALQRSPDSTTLKGTLGSLYFELGEIEPGERLLREVHATSPDTLDRGITAAYLAVLASRRKEKAEAAHLIGLATEHTADHPLVQRILKDAGLYGEQAGDPKI